LAEGSIGLPQVLFQSVAHMGPAQAVAFSLLFGFAVAGPALPLSAAIGLVAIVLIANSVGQLAKQMPSAGGLYTYASAALGPKVGFMVGWCFLVVELLVPYGYALIGGIVAQGASERIGLAVPWWVWALALIALFTFLNYRSVELSTNAGLVFGTLEVVIMLALAATMIVAAASANTLAVFDPANALEGGWAGVFKGMIFVMLAAQGFEAAAPLGGEARNPRRTVPRAVMLSAVFVGLFYLVMSYAVVMGWGFDRMGSYVQDPDPISTLATSFWAIGWAVVFLAIFYSAIAGGNAGAVASTRTLFSMGRNNVLPRILGRTHPLHLTPHVATLAMAVVAGTLILITGLVWGPSDSLGIFATTLTLLILLVYIAVCIGVPIYYLRERREEFNLLLHGAAPAAAALVLLAPLYFQFNPLPEYPILWGTWFALAAVLVGVAVMVFAAIRRPGALAAAQEVFAGSQAPVERPVTAHAPDGTESRR